MANIDPAKLKKVSINLPFGIGGAEWEPDPTERKAAWSLYIELVTRIAVHPLHADQGLLRESLNSLYSLFATTRQILKESGPVVGASKNSVGGIAITVLNNGLRPFLSKWHPMLEEWELQRPNDVSRQQHEKQWPMESQLRAELENLRLSLERYSMALAEIVGM